MVSFSVDLEGFSWRLRVEAAPSVPRARRLRVEVGSGIFFSGGYGGGGLMGTGGVVVS